MSVARSDESTNLSGHSATGMTRRRPMRKSVDIPTPTLAVARETTGGLTTPPIPSTLGPSGNPATRLDDLYRLPMPKLFNYAEREGINEHTGMNRGQLIMGIVRRQIERGLIVRGSGTLEVLPDGYGFLRIRGPQLSRLARKTFTCRRARFAGSDCGPGSSSKGRSACPSKARTTSPSCRSIRSTASRPRNASRRPTSRT